MERQMTLAEINDELGAARTNKKEFLEKLEAIIPWETFVELIQPSYYKGELGNKPYPLELMLRIFILQNVYNLADMAVMNEVIDSRAFSNFCGIMDTPLEKTGNDFGVEIPEEINTDLRDIVLTEEMLAKGNRLMDMNLPKGMLVMLIKRGNEFMIPNGSLQLHAGDKLLIISESKTK